MSKKHLLNQTKSQVVDFFQGLPNDVQYIWATTDYNAPTEMARLRRQLVTAMNNRNLRRLKV